MSDEEKKPGEDKIAEDADVEQEATDEEAGAGEDGEEAKLSLKEKLARLKVIILITVIVLALVGAVAGIYFSGILHVDKKHEVNLALPDQLVYHEIPTITVDLKPSAKRQRPFIRLVLQAELEGEAARDAFIKQEAKILDAIHTHLRSITLEEINGKEGTERLRADIVMVINRIIRPERVVTVLYKEIMVR